MKLVESWCKWSQTVLNPTNFKEKKSTTSYGKPELSYDGNCHIEFSIFEQKQKLQKKKLKQFIKLFRLPITVQKNYRGHIGA